MAVTAPPRPSTRPMRSRSTTRRLVALLLVLLALLLAIVLGTFVGARGVSPGEVVAILLGRSEGTDAVVILTQRLPRTLVGALVGIALGIAGALMQGHTRNPLADPGLFGVNAGAAFGVVLLTFLFGIRDLVAVSAAALVGAFVVSALVMVAGIGHRRGSSPVTLAVVGVTVSAMLASITGILILLDEASLDVMRFWAVGSISGGEYAEAALMVVVLLIGLALAAVNTVGLNALALGDDVAAAQGTNLRNVRVVGLLAIAVLCGGATAIAGPIAFVGLVVPHAGRLLVGPDHRWLVPISGLLGGVLLLVADVVGRISVGGTRFPVGISMAIVGVPVLLALVSRRRLMAL